MRKKDKMPFALSLSALILLFVLYPINSIGGEFYKWVDAEGTVHVTDNIAGIPPQYRDQVQKRTSQATVEPKAKQEAKPEPQKSIDTKNTVQPGFSLKRFEVPYRPFEGTARRIIIPVTLNNSVPARLILDTSSPGLVISPELADRLGLFDRQDGNLLTTAGGIGGTVPAVLSVVDTVNVGDAHAEFLPTTITQIGSDDYEGLVGMDFVANYRIGIDTTKNVLVFDELPPKPESPAAMTKRGGAIIFKAFRKQKRSGTAIWKKWKTPDSHRAKQRSIPGLPKANAKKQTSSCANWRHMRETTPFPSTGDGSRRTDMPIATSIS
jgi:hypothetical protein